MQRAHVLAVVLALVAGAPCSLTLANGQAPLAAPQQGVDINEYTSGAVSRVALFDLRSIENPTTSDYAITLSLLNLAQALNPNDADIARRRSEAAWLAGDEAELMAATEQVVKLDPRDTVATLRAITARIGKLQTSDERLAAYDRAIGAQQLDSSIRSRMSLDAALLLKERGDEAGFVQRLKQACQLDSTNKDAALMALNYFTERSTDAMGRLELVSNLLMTDPLDVKVHERLRDEFAAAGAWKAAARFHGIAATIYNVLGVRDTMPLQVGSTILHWKSDGVRATLDSINTSLAEQRASVGRIANQQGSAFLERPEDVRAAEPFEEIRLAAAIASQRPNDIAASATDMSKTLQTRVDYLRDRGRRPADMTDEKAQQTIHEALIKQTLWLCLVEAMAIKPPADAPAPVPTAGGPTAPPPAPTVAPTGAESPIVDAWIAIAKKDYPKATQLLDQAGDSLWTDLGRALVLSHTVADGEAARAFLRVSDRAPLTALGAMSAEIAERLSKQEGGARPLTNVDAEKFEAFARTIPAWVDAMPTKPYSFQSMRVEPTTSQVGSLNRAYVRVKIKNLAPVPLGLGAGRTISSRMLFVPSLSSNNAAPQAYEPEVIELDRRMRLMPQEELEALVWPEVGMVGFATEQNSHFPSRVRWRVIQGFETAGQGKRRPGLGCVESQLDTGILHEALPEARATGEDLLRRIETDNEASLPALLVGIRLKFLAGRDPANDRLADAIVRRFPNWSPTARILALATLPAAQHMPALRGIEAALAQEKDPRVLLIGVITRTTGPNDPILAAASASTDPAVLKAAAGVKDRIARQLKQQDPNAGAAPVAPPAQGEPTAPNQAQPAAPVQQPPVSPK